MRKLFLFLIFTFIFLETNAQDITGQWFGILKVPGSQYRLVFNISKSENGFKSTMDSPDQGAKGIPISITSFNNDTLKLSLPNLTIEYVAKLSADYQLVGTFKQGGYPFPLNLAKEKVSKTIPKRPQEPKIPFPYYTEEVIFENKDSNVTLSGTLTMPEKVGKFPAVILISGSGAQNRDSEILSHKPFLVLADYLSKNGIAVLRYDDRGTAKSTGNYSLATSYDLSKDVEAGLKYLQTRNEINDKKIGLIGHSEGGIIAPMVASRSKDIAFIVMMAGSGLRGDELLLLQQELIGKVSNINNENRVIKKEIFKEAFELIVSSNNTEKLIFELENYFLKTKKGLLNFEKPSNISEADFGQLIVAQLKNPWMQYFIKYDPNIALEKVKCPVLALNGEKDLQVPPKENLQAIKLALDKGKNKKVVIKELKNLNHLFQECTSGSPAEYEDIEQTISPIALEEILDWLKIQMK
jgi:fermentation-respiration switch protein FrsA (DUF1100 family)